MVATVTTSRKYRDFKYNETLFELFAKQYEMAHVDESREGAVIQVLDVAQPPERKSKPKKALIAANDVHWPSALRCCSSSSFAKPFAVQRKRLNRLRSWPACASSWAKALGRRPTVRH